MRLGQTLVVIALGLAAAGCGDKAKGPVNPGLAPAGPNAGGSDAEGMKDGSDPGGGGNTPGSPGTGDGAGGDGTGGDGTAAGGDGTGAPGGEGTAEEPAGPPIVTPNLDPDPAVAKKDVDAHLKIARDALRGKPTQPDTAIKEAQLALRVDPTSVDAVVVLAHAYYHKKLYDTAEVVLDMLFKEREVAKSNAGVYYVYGLIYDKTNQEQKAFIAYQKAVELAPNHESALINLGVHQLRNKQYQAAISTYEKLTGPLSVNDASTWNSLGSAYRGKAADYDPGAGPRDDLLLKAESAFKRATTLGKDYGPAYYNLGLLYLDANPFPGDGGPMDTLVRLQRSKTYFNEYKALPGADIELFEERTKNVDKAIKNEEKRRKKAGAANPS